MAHDHGIACSRSAAVAAPLPFQPKQGHVAAQSSDGSRLPPLTALLLQAARLGYRRGSAGQRTVLSRCFVGHGLLVLHWSTAWGGAGTCAAMFELVAQCQWVRSIAVLFVCLQIGRVRTEQTCANGALLQCTWMSPLRTAAPGATCGCTEGKQRYIAAASSMMLSGGGEF